MRQTARQHPKEATRCCTVIFTRATPLCWRTWTHNPIIVRALALDALESMRMAFHQGTRRGLQAADVSASTPAVLPFGLEGGPLRGHSVLACTVTMPSPLLTSGRTNLIGLVYAFHCEIYVSAAMYRHIVSISQVVRDCAVAVPVADDAMSHTELAITLQTQEELEVCCTLSFLAFFFSLPKLWGSLSRERFCFVAPGVRVNDALTNPELVIVIVMQFSSP